MTKTRMLPPVGAQFGIYPPSPDLRAIPKPLRSQERFDERPRGPILPRHWTEPRGEVTRDHRDPKEIRR